MFYFTQFLKVFWLSQFLLKNSENLELTKSFKKRIAKLDTCKTKDVLSGDAFKETKKQA